MSDFVMTCDAQIDLLFQTLLYTHSFFKEFLRTLSLKDKYELQYCSVILTLYNKTLTLKLHKG